MTESELERIKSAYYSGLNWSCGNWINFDAREYPYGGFSVMRKYRIVGAEYAEKAETEIKRLEKENAEAKEIIREYLSLLDKLHNTIIFNIDEDLKQKAEAFLKE